MRVKMNQMEKSHKESMEQQQVGHHIYPRDMSQKRLNFTESKCSDVQVAMKCGNTIITEARLSF